MLAQVLTVLKPANKPLDALQKTGEGWIVFAFFLQIFLGATQKSAHFLRFPFVLHLDSAWLQYELERFFLIKVIGTT